MFGFSYVAQTEAQAGTATLKAISQLQVGDEVLSQAEWKSASQGAEAFTESAQDPRLSYEKITDIFTSDKLQTLIHITLEDGNTITATEGHPFKTTEGWRDAILLKKGGKLLLKGGDDEEHQATIANISTEQKVLPVYNLEVANAHTFFVGVDGVEVHNAKKDCDLGFRPKTKGANAKDRKQIDDIAREFDINRRNFGKYIHDVKKTLGKGASENFLYSELKKLADTFKKGVR